MELPKDRRQHLACDFLAALDGVFAVQQYLGLDDGHHIRFLAQSRIARKRMRIGLDRELCWSSWANGDDRAPFRKPRTKLIVLRESSAQSVEPLGDRLSWKASERFCSGIDLDAGQDADSRQIDRERLAVLGLLPQRLVIQDDTADVVRQACSRKQHFRSEDHTSELQS